MSADDQIPRVPPTLAEALPALGDGSGLSPDARFYREEVQLALRNRGMPLEALREPITPAGMHYLLTHFDTPFLGPDWRLEIGGRVSTPLRLDLEDLQARPSVTLPVTLECAGNGRSLLSPRYVSQPWFNEAVSTAEWTGTPLRGVLEEAGLDPACVDLVFTGGDRGVQGGEVQAFQRALRPAEAMREGVLLAWAMNGQPLPPQHGAPLRLIVPDWYGVASVKWLRAIEAVAKPFEGFQMLRAYRDTQSAHDPGQPMTLMRPRALMVPPGVPDFATRVRVLEAGPVELQGRAWVGRGRIERVEVSFDDGGTWHAAALDAPVSPAAWRGWSIHWEAAPGRHTLCVRAGDDQGRVQPTAPQWNYQGMGNNMVQRVPVIVV